VRERKNPGLVNGLSEKQADYFFFAAAARVLRAGAFFFAFEAVFLAAFLFTVLRAVFFAAFLRAAGFFFATGITASLVKRPFVFLRPLSSQTLSSAATHLQIVADYRSHFLMRQEKIPFWKFFFKVGFASSYGKSRL